MTRRRGRASPSGKILTLNSLPACRRITALALLGIAFTASTLFPQELENRRVRVTAPTLFSEPVTGTLVSVSPNSLLLADRPDRRLVIPTASLTRLELSRGTNRALLWGTLAGAVAGGIATATFLEPFCADEDNSCGAGTIIFGIGVLFVPTTLIGAVLGGSLQKERWEEVSLDTIGLERATRSGPGIRLSISVPSPL